MQHGDKAEKGRATSGLRSRWSLDAGCKKGRKPMGDNAQQVTSIVSSIAGKVDIEQLKASFNKQFPCCAEWKVTEFGNNILKVGFPSKGGLEEMSVYEYFCLRGSSAMVK